MTFFTRQETLSMTGMTSGKLSYLDEKGIVSPHKFGNSKRPKVIYSVEQVICLMVISGLRGRLPLNRISKVIDFIKERNYGRSLFTCKLVFINDNPHVIEDWEEFGVKVLATAREDKGRVNISDCGQIGDVILDLKKEAERHQVLDYGKRIQGTPLA